MIKRNRDIRNALRNARIPVWYIAEKFGVSDMTMYRRLRKTFKPEEKEKIFAIIKEIQKERGA